jgi:hypothetical protein
LIGQASLVLSAFKLGLHFLSQGSLKRSNALLQLPGKQWRLTANGSAFDGLLKEVANSGIMVFSQNDDADARLSKLAAASSLKHIPIMLKDEALSGEL